MGNKRSVQYGGTIYLREGTYSGDFVSLIEATAAGPVTIRPYPGEHAILDGSVTIRGTYTVWRDLEFTYSGWTKRTTELPGNDPADMPYNKAINVHGVGTALVNCVVHDTRGGINPWSDAIGAQVRGCLIFNTDFHGPVNTYGHAIYTQNATGLKVFKNVVIAQGYSGWGIHAYSDNGALTGFRFENVFHYMGRLLIGGGLPVDDVILTNVHVPLGRLELGYQSDVTNGTATVNDCVVKDATRVLGDWGTNDERIIYNYLRQGAAAYNEVQVWPNDDDDDRATIVIYNAALAATVNVDLSALPLTVGRAYVLRNYQNYYGDTPFAFTYTGAAVAVPLTGWTVATPIGASEPLFDSSFPAFGCLLLETI